jgi:hypothetical protein
MNKLAVYYNPKDLTGSLKAKKGLYEESVALGALAHKSNGKTIPLMLGNLEDVDFVGGLWRVQDHSYYPVKYVRDCEFVLGKQLSATELTQYEIKFFDYYKAALVFENAYGSDKTDYNYIVANFGKYWAYGNNVSQARAFLAVKVLDEGSTDKNVTFKCINPPSPLHRQGPLVLSNKKFPPSRE